MIKTEYTCDKCKKIIDGGPVSTEGAIMVGGGELCTIFYEGIMGHNQFPDGGFHYHYECFITIVKSILKSNK